MAAEAATRAWVEQQFAQLRREIVQRRLYATHADEHQDGGRDFIPATSSAGAPNNAQYLVLAASGSLTAERIWTPGSGLQATDAGAGSTYTVKLGNLTEGWTNAGVFDISTAGNLTVLKHLAVGAASAIDAYALLSTTETFTDPVGSPYLWTGALTKALTAANATDAYAASLNVVVSGAFADTGINAGYYSQLTRSTNNVNSTSSDFRNFWAASVHNAGTTVTNRYGLYVSNGLGSGTLTNQYGVYIENMAKGGTLNRAIYSAGGISVHAGRMTIGAVTAPDSFAVLDLVATGTGVLMPRMTTAQAPSSATDGLIWYDSTTGKFRAREAGADVDLRSASAPTNALLDGSAHSDTVAQAVSRGSLVYGNSTPKWDELTIGAANKVLHSDGTDVSWQALVDADLPAASRAAEITTAKLRTIVAQVDVTVASTTVPYVLVGPMPAAGTISTVYAKLGENKTNGATASIFDIHKITAANQDTDGQGTTIYTTQGNRPTIASTHMATTATNPDVTSFAAGDWFAFYTDQAGTSATVATVSMKVALT